MSEATALPTIKRLALTNKLSLNKSQKNDELPKSVTEKLEFLRAHKQDIEKNALSDFISKKCSSLSDNEKARSLRKTELTKVVSSRTASLVNNTKNTRTTSTRLSNISRKSTEKSKFFDKTKSTNEKKATSRVNGMDNLDCDLDSDLDFETVFGDEDIPIAPTRKRTSTPTKLSSIRDRPVSPAETGDADDHQAKKRFKFGRVASTNIFSNPFNGYTRLMQVNTQPKLSLPPTRTKEDVPTIPVNAKHLELPEFKCQVLPKTLTLPRLPEKHEPIASCSSTEQNITDTSKNIETSEKIAKTNPPDDYNEFLLTNINWDDEEDWPEDNIDLDSTLECTSPLPQLESSRRTIITAGDYVDDNFDFSQLGLDDASTSTSKCGANVPSTSKKSEVVDLDDSFNLAFEDDFDDGPSTSSNFNSTINMMNSLQVPVAVGAKEAGFVPIDKDAKTRKDDTAVFQKEYPHSLVLREILHEKFGLKEFRPNQQEIINATLELHDCFVLMPTGGGKSLCYQLPAILTPGVTVVISPLRALIVDQVNKLTSLDIPAAHMCSDISKETLNNVLRSLTQLEPSIKLLYLTPEKIIGSRQTFDLLIGLYTRGKLARVVLDEAHCISQWGHDFRPDYKQLTTLKANFPKTPMMCLTATATNVVQQDVINILKLKRVKTFIRSFNRANIKYAVLEKSKALATAEIVKLIQQHFRRMSGIVYCLVRKDCDTLAMDLRKHGIKAKSYHAGLADKKREEVQSQWMNNEYHVICATIAFGMGIDKPDVRFVMHNSMPKSIESFYQESGRGGRDGEIAYSYLFYAYGDVVRLQKIIKMDKSITNKNLEGHFDQVAQMAQYCENRIDCRRYLQLQHLGEKFNRQLCMQNRKTICDNCANFGTIEVQNVSKESRELAALVRDIGSHRNFTMLHYVDVYRGAKIKKIIDLRHNAHKYYGAGAHLNKNDVHRIMKELAFKKVLKDVCEYGGEFPVIYIQPGPNYEHLFRTDAVLTIPISSKGKKATTAGDDGPAFIEDLEELEELPARPETPPAKKKLSFKPVAKKAAPVSPSKAPERRIWALKVKCHEELLEKCAEFAAQQHSNLSSIMNLSAIKVMSEEMPANVADFMKTQYVTKANFEKYGKEFLLLTQKYRRLVDQIEAENVMADLNADALDDDWGESPNTSANSNNSFRGVKRKFTKYKRGKGSWKRRRK